MGKIEHYYNQLEQDFRKSWDEKGTCHFGYFEDLTNESFEAFLSACARWETMFLARLPAGPEAAVLDVGCGNGLLAMRIAEEKKCSVHGLDLSTLRIENARRAVPEDLKHRVQFTQGSAAVLPFADDSFDYVVSMAALFLVDDRDAAFSEIARVLKPGGTLLFDDLMNPGVNLSQSTQENYVARFGSSGLPQFETMVVTLSKLGFHLLEVERLTEHLRLSYHIASVQAERHGIALSSPFAAACAAVDDGDLGWWCVCAQRGERADPS